MTKPDALNQSTSSRIIEVVWFVHDSVCCIELSKWVRRGSGITVWALHQITWIQILTPPTYLCKLMNFSMMMMIIVTKMIVSIYRVWRPSDEVIHYGFSTCLTHTVFVNVSCYRYWNKRVETTTKRVRRQEKRKMVAGPVYILSSAPGRG